MQRYRAPDSVAVEEVDGDLILLDLERGDFFVARGTGLQAWRLLVSGHSIEEVVDEMAARYRVPAGRLRTEIGTFVSQLLRDGLLLELADGRAG